MDDCQLERYSRHILLPQIDLQGQQSILNGHVLIVGLGGLGSPCALYLAAAGVGRLTLCDFDSVDLTNLQRQVLHRDSRIGVNKAVSARAELASLNSACQVDVVTDRATLENLRSYVAEADIVVDCSDNFETRHAINRLCVATQRPLVTGAAIQMSGQISVFDIRDQNSPCYACFLPEGTQTGDLDCGSSGILGPVTGTIGSMQATEVLKLLAQGMTSLSGRVLLYDAMLAEWETMPIQKNPMCDVCR